MTVWIKKKINTGKVIYLDKCIIGLSSFPGRIVVLFVRMEKKIVFTKILPVSDYIVWVIKIHKKKSNTCDDDDNLRNNSP